MRRGRPVFVSFAVLAVISVVTAVAAGAFNGSRSRVEAARLPVTPNFANINRENRHLLKVPPMGHHVVVGERPVRLKIPSLKLDSPIIPTHLLGGTTWQVADWAVGDMVGFPNPGTCTVWAQLRTCVTALSGHDDIKGELFRRAGQLKRGATIVVLTHNTKFTYRVVDKLVVSQYDSSRLFDTVKSVALVTCTPYWQDTHRLIVVGKLVRETTRRF